MSNNPGQQQQHPQLVSESEIAIDKYSSELAPRIPATPQDLQEIHDYITDTFNTVDEDISKFEITTANNQSTAENTTFTHEPLYHAKEQLVQLTRDLLSDDTHKVLNEHKDHPLTSLVTLALLKICQVAADVVNKGAETSEAYRWILTGCKLIEKMQGQQSTASITSSSPSVLLPCLSQEEMKSCIDLRWIAKYSAAPIPNFFPSVANSSSSSSLNPIGSTFALELLVHAAQIWTLWTEPENVRKIADVAEKMCKLVPGTGGVLYTSIDDKPQDGSSYLLSKSKKLKQKLTEVRKRREESSSSSSSSADLDIKSIQDSIDITDHSAKNACLQEADVMIRLETKRASRSKEPLWIFVPPKWSRPYLNYKYHIGFIATTPKAMLAGQLESPQFCEDRLLDLFTCIVQAYKGSPSSHIASYYSTQALQYRLPMYLHEDRSSLDEWIGLCLSLAEYYIEERDLSHAEHLIDVCRALMGYFGAEKGALTTISTYKGYKTPNGVMMNLLRVKLTGMKMKLYLDSLTAEQEKISPAAATASSSKSAAADQNDNKDSSSSTKVKVKLYQNPLCAPEEYNGVTITESNKPSTWSTKQVDTAKRINLIEKCSDKELHANVQAPQETVEITFAELKNMCEKSLTDFLEKEKIIPDLLAALDVNEDCERFILSRRAVSEFYSVVFNLTKKIIVAEKRLNVLSEIRGATLHENVFRNVLRQAEFEYGTQSITVGDMLPPESEQRLKYYSQARESLNKFCKSFEKEIASAKEASVPIPLEGSDFVAYGLGCMRRIEVLLKLSSSITSTSTSTSGNAKEKEEEVEKLHDEAQRNAKSLIEFATTYSKEGGERLAEMKALANEFVKALTGKGVIEEITSQIKKVEKKVVVKKVVVAKHKDPSNKK